MILNSVLTPNIWYADLTPPDGYLDYGIQAVDGLTQNGSLGWTELAYSGNPPGCRARRKR